MKTRTSQRFKYLSALMAFILWGGWAFYINQSPANNSGIISGLLQGIASFTMTLFIVSFVTYLFSKFTHPVARLIIPALITVAFSGLCLVLLHALAGTSQIFHTILPPLSVAFLFSLFTAYKLQSTLKPRDNSNE